MNLFLILLLIQDSAALLGPALPHQDLTLPPPPIGGSKDQWIGYFITVSLTLIFAAITRKIERGRMISAWEKKNTNPFKEPEQP